MVAFYKAVLHSWSGSMIWMISGGILELCLGSNIEYHWIGLGRYLEHTSLDEGLYNSGAQQFIVWQIGQGYSDGLSQ